MPTNSAPATAVCGVCAAHHASAWSTWVAVGPPSTRARDADTTTDRGWFLAKAWSQPGMELTGTKAEEANTNGAIIGKAAAWVDSGRMR